MLPGRLVAWTAHTAYWMSYLDMVEILLEMIRASREGNWPLHLHAIRMMISWCAAYDKVNYARYLSTIMLKLPDWKRSIRTSTIT